MRLNPFRSLPNPRQVWAWGMYDLANQSFTLLIVTLFYAIYFQNTVAADPARGKFLWGIANGLSAGIIVVLGPVLGAMADFGGSKKRWLMGLALGCSGLTIALAFTGPGVSALDLREAVGRLKTVPPQGTLARTAPDDPRFAERFELYACGVELANGFGELTDPVEQRRRFEAEMDVKQATYGERYPLDAEFLAALAHMPPASGVAMGFDRLVMLASGARRIADVLWTPPERPYFELFAMRSASSSRTRPARRALRSSSCRRDSSSAW